MTTWSVMFLLAISCLCSSHPEKKLSINQPCEIVIILDYSRNIDAFGNARYDDMMNFVRQFPKHIQLSETGVRLAVIVFAMRSIILTDLTADENRIRGLSTPRAAGWMKINQALADAAIVLKQARPNAAKFVILITYGKPKYLRAAEAAADELWKSGTTIFVAFSGTDELKPHIANKIAQDVKRVLPYKNARMFLETLKMQSSDREQLVCDEAEEICSFDQHKNCMSSWWSVAEKDVKCDDPKYQKQSCPVSKCTETCNLWPWQEIECDDDNMGTINISRQEPKPQQRQALYAFCPTTKTIVCPTKQTTKIVGNASQNGGPEENATIGGDPAPNGGFEAAIFSFGAWAIALIVLIILLLLLLIIVAVLVNRRGRRPAKERHKRKPPLAIPSPAPGQKNSQSRRQSTSRGPPPGSSSKNKWRRKGNEDLKTIAPAETRGSGQVALMSAANRPSRNISSAAASSGHPLIPSFDVAYDRDHKVKKADKSAGVSLPTTQHKKQSRGQHSSRGAAPGPPSRDKRRRKGKRMDTTTAVSFEPTGGNKKRGRTRKRRKT